MNIAANILNRILMPCPPSTLARLPIHNFDANFSTRDPDVPNSRHGELRTAPARIRIPTQQSHRPSGRFRARRHPGAGCRCREDRGR